MVVPMFQWLSLPFWARRPWHLKRSDCTCSHLILTTITIVTKIVRIQNPCQQLEQELIRGGYTVPGEKGQSTGPAVRDLQTATRQGMCHVSDHWSCTGNQISLTKVKHQGRLISPQQWKEADLPMPVPAKFCWAALTPRPLLATSPKSHPSPYLKVRKQNGTYCCFMRSSWYEQENEWEFEDEHGQIMLCNSSGIFLI